MSNNQHSDVLIVGAGPSGLYAALLLGSMGVSVRIIDSKTYVSGSDNPALLLSPHTLQHLQAYDLVQPLVENGMRHWRFQLYVNQGQGANATSLERQSFRVWEKKNVQYNWALSCEATDVCNAFRETLYKRTDIRVEYQQKLVNLQDMTDHNNKSSSIDYPIVSTIKDLRTGRAVCWRSRMIIGADGAESFVRQKLGTPQHNRGMSGAPLYTLQASVESNFPGLRAVSVVKKGDDSVLMIGHRKKLYIVVEQNPKWSQLAQLDSDDDLLEAIHTHVQSILQPYDINFKQILSYRSWQATDPTLTEYSANRRWFLVGSAAQVVSPPELLSINLGLDQVHNLCWKISMHLNNYASAHLLDTFETESISRSKDYSVVSDAMMAMINNTAVYEEDVRDDTQSTSNSSVASTPMQRLKWGKSWHIGGAAYPNSDISRSSVQAPNGKLKPYNALQLQTSTLSGPKRSRSTLSSKTSSSNLSITSPSATSSTSSFLSRSRSLSSLASRSKSFLGGLPRMSTDSAPPGPGFDSQKRPTRGITRIKARGYQHYDSNSVVMASHSETWRILKANHYDLLERIAKDAHPGSFTILIFCDSLFNDKNLKTLQHFKQYMDTPSSLLQYEQRRLHDHRLSIPSESLYNGPPTPTTSSASETSTPRSSLSSGFTAATNRLSRFFSMWSSVSTIASTPISPSAQSPPPPIPATGSPLRLFSFLYITSSTRQQVNEFLTSNSAPFIHSVFPQGLERLYLDHDNITHSAYGITNGEPAVVVIRPDGYIGMRSRLDKFDSLNNYFDTFMIPPVDLDSAAADVANDYLF